MSAALKLPIIPAAFFGIVLGTAGLGNAWRLATRLWGLPAAIGETISLLAVVIWAVLLGLFIVKWLVAPSAARDELAHPVLCCFIGLVGVATMLAAGALLPYSRMAADVLFALGALYTLLFAVWRTGGLWQGSRPAEMTTAVLYLPSVAGTFVTAIVAAALGHADWGQLFFGAGLFSWLAIESVLLHRLYIAAPLSVPLRPTLGIQLAPPAVAAVAYLNAFDGAPALFAHMLVGYGLLQALIMLRLLPWILEGGFTVSFWAFTFGATALAGAMLKLAERGDTGPIALMAPIVFAGANLVVALIAIGTLYQFATGRVGLKWCQPGAARH